MTLNNLDLLKSIDMISSPGSMIFDFGTEENM